MIGPPTDKMTKRYQNTGADVALKKNPNKYKFKLKNNTPTSQFCCNSGYPLILPINGTFMISVLQSINITLTELITLSIMAAKKVPAKMPENTKDIHINI